MLRTPAKSKMAAYLDSLGFINIAEADNSIAIDLMYTRADNFTGQVLYEDLHEAYLHPEAMESLLQAQKLLKEICPDYSLIVYDAARPMSVQQKMWNVVKERPNIYTYPTPHGAVACTTMAWRSTSASSMPKDSRYQWVPRRLSR